MRKREKCLVEAIAPLQPVFHEHLDSLNISDHIHRGRFRYRLDGEEYVDLAGSLAWPGGDVPGYVLVIGVKVEGDMPVFVCLEEAEDPRPEGLLSKCLTLRERYGFYKSDRLFRVWWGDSRRFSSLVSGFNDKIKKDEPEGIYLSDPTESERPNRFELYLRRIHGALDSEREGRKVLILGECNRLKNALQNLPRDAAKRFKEDESPHVFALGALVHTLFAVRPWAYNNSPSQPSSLNSYEEWEQYARSQGNGGRSPNYNGVE